MTFAGELQEDVCELFIDGGPASSWFARGSNAGRLCHACLWPRERHPAARVETWSPAGPFIIPTIERSTS